MIKFFEFFYFFASVTMILLIGIVVLHVRSLFIAKAQHEKQLNYIYKCSIKPEPPTKKDVEVEQKQPRKAKVYFPSKDEETVRSGKLVDPYE